MHASRRPLTYTPRRKGPPPYGRWGLMLLALLVAAVVWNRLVRPGVRMRDEARQASATSGASAAPEVAPHAWRQRLLPADLSDNAGTLEKIDGAFPAAGEADSPPPVGEERMALAARGLSGSSTSRGSVTPSSPTAVPGNELPIFTRLRASRDRPVPREVAELARRLTADCPDDACRARTLYRWLTDNIRYDVQEWAHLVGGGAAYTNPHDPLAVLERGTTVCAGYAWLYNDMARSVGLNSVFLIGDVRGYRGTPDDDLVSAFQHAWNAVEVDGQWRLVDATWGARQVDEEERTYRSRQEYYFDTPARQMIFDHLPEDDRWQLLEQPVPDKDAFQSLPNLKPAFFRHELKLANGFASQLALERNERGGLVLSAPESTQVAATLTPLDGGSGDSLPVARRQERIEVLVGPLEPGEYVLRLFARRADATDVPFECGADYIIRIE